MHTSLWLTKTFVGWYNLVVISHATCDRSVMHVLVPEWWVGWEPCRLLLGPSQSVLEYYSNLTVCGPRLTRQISGEIQARSSSYFALVSFNAAARDCVFMSWTADPHIVADILGVLVSMPDRLTSWIDDLGFFPIVPKTVSSVYWPSSRFVVSKSSIGPALTSKISSFGFAGVRGR